MTEEFKPFKPMLAPSDAEAYEYAAYPVLGSPKYDGIRCIVKNGVCFSRSMKPIPSLQVQEDFGSLEDCDGELIVGDPSAPNAYNLTQSHVMSEDKPGDVCFYLFDYTKDDLLSFPFAHRLLNLVNFLSDRGEHPDNVKIVEQEALHSIDDLVAYEQEQLGLGYEGVMLKNPLGPYKQGRATARENLMYKVKRFQDDEGLIVGFEEQMTNQNEAFKNELGRTARTSHKANQVPADTLGMIQCRWKGMTLNVAPGMFTHAERKRMWENPARYVGLMLKFRYFGYGVKDMPRFPRAIGLRDKADI
jgi:DNA ligase 1